MFIKFGKGKTLSAVRKEKNEVAGIKDIFLKWLPVFCLVFGAGLVIIGILVQIGVLC